MRQNQVLLETNFQCDRAGVSGASVIALTVRRSFPTDVLFRGAGQPRRSPSSSGSVVSRAVTQAGTQIVGFAGSVRHHTSRFCSVKDSPVEHPSACVLNMRLRSSYSSRMMHGCSNSSKQQATVARSRDSHFITRRDLS